MYFLTVFFYAFFIAKLTRSQSLEHMCSHVASFNMLEFGICRNLLLEDFDHIFLGNLRM